MLILSRRPDESIHIGDDIYVVVVGVNGNTVKLGIQAPDSVGVHRNEIYKRINAAAAEAANAEDYANPRKLNHGK